MADGAGSAKHSEIGSKESVQFLLREIANSGFSLIEITRDIAADWILKTRNHLQDEAGKREIQVGDLACTTLFAILADSHCIFGQVGDGAWVIQSGDGYLAATWPSNGEYANQTTFITTRTWSEELQFSIFSGPYLSVAGFTDGLQNLALHFASRSVHIPFFESKFKVLREAEDETSLRAPLEAFLDSEPVTERTDDDKTLILACRKETMLLENGNS